MSKTKQKRNAIGIFLICISLVLVVTCGKNESVEEILETIQDDGAVNDQCADNLDFIDAHSYTCAEWEGYDCSTAVEEWGYTEEEEKDIIKNCPKSCGLCVHQEDKVGYFTGEDIITENELLSMLELIEGKLKVNFDADWFQNVESYVSNYHNGQGQLDRLEALKGLAFVSFIEDNVYPFAMTTMEAIRISPNDPFLLNSLASALIKLEYYDFVLKLLDYIHKYHPEIDLTYENAAAFNDAIGNIAEAIKLMEEAYLANTDNAFAIWNAAEYAKDHEYYEGYKRLKNMIPSNYTLENSDGTFGGAAEPTSSSFCCPCNNQFYPTYIECLNNCDEHLGCAVGYCSPSECCGGLGPFVLGIKLCYPPTGVQACITGKTDGSVEIAVQGKLAEIIQVGVKGKLSFNSKTGLKTGVAIYFGAFGRTVTVNPVSGDVSVSFSGTRNFELGSIGFSLSLPINKDWVHSNKCM